MQDRTTDLQFTRLTLYHWAIEAFASQHHQKSKFAVAVWEQFFNGTPYVCDILRCKWWKSKQRTSILSRDAKNSLQWKLSFIIGLSVRPTRDYYMINDFDNTDVFKASISKHLSEKLCDRWLESNSQRVKDCCRTL